MNNLNNELEEQQLVETENTYWVDMWKSLEILHSNPHFKRVILEGYFKDKAVNGVSMLAHRTTLQEGSRPDILESLMAVSRLQNHFITIENLGSVPEEQE
jgi:hypothetical protein